MRLLLGTIVTNNSLFCSDNNSQFLRHNVIELSKNTYFFVGQAPSLSLIHGGPAPAFFLQKQLSTTLFMGWRK